MLQFVKANKRKIYATGFSPKTLAGQFHGLFLQLLAAGILELDVETAQAKNVGSDKLLSKHIVVKLGSRETEEGVSGLAILQPAAWVGITTY